MERKNFWRVIRNPVYCGKILIPKFKDEDAHLVPGQHEPLISENFLTKLWRCLTGDGKVML
jgi:site-specific DNA recombinase